MFVPGEEVGGMLVLILQELEMSSSNKMVQYLSRLSCGGDPAVLAKIMDDVEHPKLSSAQILHLIMHGASQFNEVAAAQDADNDAGGASDDIDVQGNRFITQMDAAFEQGIFDLRDTEEGGSLCTMYVMYYVTHCVIVSVSLRLLFSSGECFAVGMAMEEKSGPLA